jgi:RNA polymerase sigma-70 factor (ECF subfamily)
LGVRLDNERVIEMDDRDLLSAFVFVSQSSADAFGEIVRRNIDLVYSAARRQLGDSNLADDVTQAVILLLARKAKTIKGPLAGWLVSATYYACRDAKKMAARREYHEGQAALLRQESVSEADEPQWEAYAPILDEALARMKSSDRDAIALRYLKGMNLAEVAAMLGINEKAAEKRVSRAIERLRQMMSGQVMMPAVAVIALEMLGRGSQAAPTKLAATIVHSGTAIGKGTLVAIIARKAGQAMYWTRLKIAAMVLGAVTAAGTGTGTVMVLADEKPAATPVLTPMTAPLAAQQSMAPFPPVVVKTEPQAGLTDVDPNTTEIRATFSKEMLDSNWSWVQISAATFPSTSGTAHYLADQKTCVLPVKLQPNHVYVLWLNQGRFQSFEDRAGHTAVPYLLVFQTRGG